MSCCSSGAVVVLLSLLIVAGKPSSDKINLIKFVQDFMRGIFSPTVQCAFGVSKDLNSTGEFSRV